MDKAHLNLSPNESFFLLNHSSLLSIHNSSGNSSGVKKPFPANYLACDIHQPAGEVYTVGAYRSPLTKEIYSWHINSNGVNYILRTKESGCQIVYYDGCLDLSAEPRNSIENWRAFLHIEKICSNRHGRQLIWVNGNGDICQLDVEASIATNGFTTPFFNRCGDPCAYLRMCVPDPCGCVNATWLPFDANDINKNNLMLDAPFQFIYRHHYYDGRKGEWSTPSSTYYQNSKQCSISGLSRGIKLRLPIGNPFVDKIEVGFSNGEGAWYSVEIVEKYKKYNDAQQKWYERQLSNLDNYSDVDCSFDYYFYNDRQKLSIDPKEISRVHNPIPRDVQGFIPVKDSFGFYNYVDGACPVDAKEIEKFRVSLDCANKNICATEYATIKFRAVIINQTQNRAAFVFRNGIPNATDDPTEPAMFGAESWDLSLSYGQQFNGKTRNFIAYVEGTDYWTQLNQWEASNGFTNLQKSDVIPLDKTWSVPIYGSAIKLKAEQLKRQGKYMYQEGILKVPKGMKGVIRLTSHFSENGIGSNQDKSTNVVGIFDIRNYVNGSDILPSTNTGTFELAFNTCNGDVDIFNAFYVRDNSADAGGGTAYSGYIKDADDQPIANATLNYQGQSSVISVTDHNGFYNFHKSGADNADIEIKLENNCSPGFSVIRQTTLDGIAGRTSETNLTITENDYSKNFYSTVIVPVVDCNGTPVSGVVVALSGDKYKLTNQSGEAIFKVRNNTSRNKVVTAYVMNGGGCIDKDCNGKCSPCMPSSTAGLASCFLSKPTVRMSNQVINNDTFSAYKHGLKNGGKYQFAVNFKGGCGKISAAYPINTLDIPKTQQKGYFGFCTYLFNAAGMVAPDWADCLQILRSDNLNGFELQWKVDKIERTDDGRLKLTIQSLNDYNTQYGFKTNTTYQWVKGDRVEFIYNGDGSILTSAATQGLLNYLVLNPFHDEVISGLTNADSKFFNQLLIQDDGRLSSIKEGAIIELQRALPVQEEQIYYSICATIPVVNGQLVQNYGSFSTFDTFAVNRIISGTFGSYVGLFEHHSPSDFWGNKVSDKGKAYVYNAYENEKRFGRYITINSPTNFSRFGDLIKRFDAPGQGDITAMWIVDGKVILAICETDNFIAQVSDELVRVGGDGIIRALPADAVVSEAQPKVSGEYGCQYDDIGSIFFGDGFATFYDGSKKAYILHDYNSARNVGINKFESYFKVRGQQKENHNKTQSDAYNKYRWATGQNFANGEIYLTLKKLRDSAIFNEHRSFVSSNDTLRFLPGPNESLGYASFTPEFYSYLELNDIDGCAFITFANGKPYVHPINSALFNEFYGIACDEMFAITINQEPKKVKRCLAIELKSGLRWFSKEITTDNPNFISEIPAVRWHLENKKWSANFLFNKNSRGGLYGNTKDVVPEDTRGRFINVLMIRDNTDALKYNTIDNNKRTLYNETDEVIVKYAVVEQTGFEMNL